MPGETPVSILCRLIDLGQTDLSPGAAEAVSKLRLTDADQARIEELADKSNAGALSAEDADEYDAYLTAADLLSLWQAKARASLKRQPSAA